MNQPTSLKEFERKAFRSTYEDGLMDLLLGALLLLMGLGPILPSYDLSIPVILGIMLAVAAAVYGLFYGGKRLITLPRMGRIKFGQERKKKLSKLTATLIASALLGLVMFAVVFFRNTGMDTMLSIILIVWAAQAIIVFSIGAYYLDQPRFYLYGVLFAAPFPLAVYLDNLLDWGEKSFMVTYGAASGIILLIGLTMLALFIRKYDIPQIEEGQ